MLFWLVSRHYVTGTLRKAGNTWGSRYPLCSENDHLVAKPRINPEFVTFWLHKFRKLDVRQQPHRKMLIAAFVNAIYLYDDKLVLTFNYKDGTRTISLDDVKEAVKNNPG